MAVCCSAVSGCQNGIGQQQPSSFFTKLNTGQRRRVRVSRSHNSLDELRNDRTPSSQDVSEEMVRSELATWGTHVDMHVRSVSAVVDCAKHPN